jgi:hypothetical protein
MMLYCLVDYIAQAGMEKVILKNDLYTLEARAKPVENGICSLKVNWPL